MAYGRCCTLLHEGSSGGPHNRAERSTRPPVQATQRSAYSPAPGKISGLPRKVSSRTAVFVRALIAQRRSRSDGVRHQPRVRRGAGPLELRAPPGSPGRGSAAARAARTPPRRPPGSRPRRGPSPSAGRAGPGGPRRRRSRRRTAAARPTARSARPARRTRRRRRARPRASSGGRRAAVIAAPSGRRRAAAGRPPPTCSPAAGPAARSRAATAQSASRRWALPPRAGVT